MLKIGKVAKILGVTVPTIRNMEKDGRLVPSHKDAKTGYRSYTEQDIKNYLERK